MNTGHPAATEAFVLFRARLQILRQIEQALNTPMAFLGLAWLRGLQLVRIAASVNRGMKALARTLRWRGFGYVLGLTVMVTFAGAAGMLYFERQTPQGGLQDFWTALWWTAMAVTTMGSEYWPKTVEGRTLCLFLAIYAFAVFGYVTGTIATYFIGRDGR